MPRVSRTLRLACALALGGLLLSLLPLLGPAQAITSGYLCTGYTACKNAGYPNAGYAANNHRMYWRMYSGHNCTNYVAYRMVKAGMPNVRPWSGGGNATNWGVRDARASPTSSPGSARSPGGGPTSPAPAQPATSRTSSG